MADHRIVNNADVNTPAPTQSINLENFSKQIKLMYSHWDEFKNDMWGGSEAFSVATPPASDDLLYLKSSALNMWLVGYEFPDTIMVFMKKEIHFLCSQKKASLLQALTKPARDAVGVEVIMHVKGRNHDGSALMDDILEAVRGYDTPIFGHIAGEGSLLVVWDEKLRNANFQLSDVTNGLSDLFAVKDCTEIRNVREAAYLTSSVVEHFLLPKLRKMIDKKQAVTNSSLKDATIEAITEAARIKLKLNAENVDICYPPIFESRGEDFCMNPDYVRAYSTGVIIYALGSRYKGYCSNVGRTLLFHPSSRQRKAYEVLLKAHEAAIGALQPGNKAGDAYLAAVAVVEHEGPEFTPYLTKSAGSGMGLEFCEASLSLNGKNERIVRSGMVLSVSLGFENLDGYSLLLADTVIIGQTSAEVVTSTCVKAAGDVSYLRQEMLPHMKEEIIRACKDLERRDRERYRKKKNKVGMKKKNSGDKFFLGPRRN